MAITTANISEDNSKKDNLEHWCFEKDFEQYSNKGYNAAKFFINFKPKGTIVDLGAGDCCSSDVFVDTNKTIAVDINKQKLNRGRPEVNKINKDFITYLKAQKDNSVDNYFTHHALEHFVNPRKVINEIERTLVKGGLACIVVPLNDGVHSVHHSSFEAIEDLLPNGGTILFKENKVDEGWLVWQK